ncbi:protein split ends isoform X3 [Aethina tumida]|uniref:protein split ends isoform X3 n=1 Tax=Aethina tumida TaxID=116153 RepID=UPI00214841A7|nr:protein split ends isoform X3 [Aethina tumida]
MVRETRHLWVGNLPENIREDRIREQFKRYGRVQSVKLLPRVAKEETGEISMACTVAFMDIRSASKAHNSELKIDDRTLNTEYYEPAAIPSSASAAANAAAAATVSSPQHTPSPYSTSPAAGSNRFPNGHGSSDEPFPDRFYDRGASRVSSDSGVGDFLRRSSTSQTSYVPSESSRGRVRDRGCGGGGSTTPSSSAFRGSNGPYNPIVDRHRTANVAGPWGVNAASLPGGGYPPDSGPNGGRYLGGGSGSSGGCGGGTTGTSQSDSGYGAAAAGGDVIDRRSSDAAAKKTIKTKSRSGSRTPSPSGSTSSRSPTRSRSRSSSTSSRSSSTSRATSSTGSPKSRGRQATTASSANSSSNHSHHQGAVHSDDRRPLAICVKNLPLRSSDTSLKDGLFHEYKKHGKVTWVKVVGQNADRHAIVCFKKPEDVEKAIEVSYDKLFFGHKIEVAPYQGYDVVDNDQRPYEADLDEFHPKATRTLFIGNLEKDMTASDLRKIFDQFGEIIEIDIKKQGTHSSYAFCQYSDIVSVVKAIRKMDGEHVGLNRVKLGFGKSMPTNCVWVDNVADIVSEKYLKMQFDQFGAISKVHVDREKGQALIFFEQVVSAQTAVNKMRGFALKSQRVQVDFASRECQQSFFEHLEKQGAELERTGVFDDVRRDSSSRAFESASARYSSRYDTPTRPRTSSYTGSGGRSGASVPGAAPSQLSSATASAMQSPGGACTPGSATPRSRSRLVSRYDYYDQSMVDYVVPSERLAFRAYDDAYSQGSPASHDDYEAEYYQVHSPLAPHIDMVESRSLQSVDATTGYHQPDNIRNLQKERVHLLEQLEECPSSGDELLGPSKKRLKLDSDVIIEANRDHRKVMEVRRLSDANLKHHSSRRPSIDSGKHAGHDRTTYMPHAVCKRRKTGGSDSSSRLQHQYDHSGSESLGGSRPGTPLFDERPENFQPTEPRRTPRDREGPLTLPLPRFAAQVMNRGRVSVAGIKGQDNLMSSPPPAVTSPRISNPRPPSPVQFVPPPASPPPRPHSLSSNSSDSDTASPSLDERIKDLDVRYEQWSGSRVIHSVRNASDVPPPVEKKFRIKSTVLDSDINSVPPSDIVKSVLAKRSVFDEDLKRLENVSEKYEPKEWRAPTIATVVPASATAATLTSVPALQLSTQPQLKMGAAAVVVQQQQQQTIVLSPRSSGATIAAAKGLQYPFPSHPPMQPSPLTPTTTASASLTPPSASLTTSATSIVINTATTTISSVTTATTTTSARSGAANAHGDTNRLKPCPEPCPTPAATATAASDARTCKVPSNRCGKNAQAQLSSGSDKSTSNNIPGGDKTKHGSVSDKIACRRDSNSGGSPRAAPADVRSRRNSDASARKPSDDSDVSEKQHRKERARSEERKKERLEKIRLENERLEKEKAEKERVERERLEKEKQEKERLEKERLDKERQERESELEKERLQKERIEKERLEKEREEMERRRQHEKEERERKEREEKERREREEKERREREEKERREREEQLEKERKERERKEREERERREREKEERLRKEQEERERREAQRKEREEQERAEKNHDRRHKDDNHEKRKDEHRHRENHSEKTENKHRENILEKHLFEKSTKESKEEKKDSHENCRRESHGHDKSRHHVRDEERRKESIKENRDNNIHDKHKNFTSDLKESKDKLITTESRHMSLDIDKKSFENSLFNVGKDPSKRKERNNSLPANLGKRRMSSHESLDGDDHKRIKLDHKKLSERRDSKDSTRSEDKIKSKHKNNSIKHDKHNNAKESDEKRKEKDREERHKKHKLEKLEKQKLKSKSKEKESRESPTTPKSPLSDKDFLARLDLRATDEVQKKESSKEKRKDSTEDEKRDKDEKKVEDRVKKEKDKDKQLQHQSSRESEKSSKARPEENTPKSNDERKSSHKREQQRIRKITNSSDTDTDDDEPKKHSIFDIVDDEPAYISMYDKVKARSCKNMQKQEEEKRQEKIKAKFSQLKQSRAKREEKKRSTSWDEDSDSERDRVEKNDFIKLKRSSKLCIVSSEDEEQDMKPRKKKDLDTDSDSDRLNKNKFEPISDDDRIRTKNTHFRGSKSRITSDTSDDDFRKTKDRPDAFSDDQEMADPESKPFTNEIESIKETKKERRNSKHQEENNTQVYSGSCTSTPVLLEKEKFKSSFPENTSDEDTMELKKERTDRKKHKKKQKKQKHSFSSEDLNKMETIQDGIHNESTEKSKHHEKKRQHSKKDKKRDKSKDERDKTKKSKKNKSESKSDNKCGKVENLFGSLSEDSENGTKDAKENIEHPKTMFVPSSKFVDESAQSAYNSESEMDRAKLQEEKEREREEHKRRKEKRRKEKQERRLQEAAEAAAAAQQSNENSMDFADMGKQLEANIKDETVEEIKNEVDKTDNNDDSFAFNETSEVKETIKEERKKKKRKKSKEEKQKHHHHHHHEKNKLKSPEFKKEQVEFKKESELKKEEIPAEVTTDYEKSEFKTEFKKESTPTKEIKIEIEEPKNQSMPTILEYSPENKSSNKLDFSISPINREPLISPIPKTPTTSKDKKRDKLILGLVDQNLHESAVKSIPEFEPVKQETTIKEEEIKTEVATESPEEKPRVVISQEETEDAVAALLGESFNSAEQFEECYTDEINSNNEQSQQNEENVQDDEEMRQAVQSLSVSDLDAKPDTPQSEHELQIDTDTEEQEDIGMRFDQPPKTPELLVPPKTPDIPSYFRNTDASATHPPIIVKAGGIGSPPSLAPITKPVPSQPPPLVVAEVKKPALENEPKSMPMLPEQQRVISSPVEKTIQPVAIPKMEVTPEISQPPVIVTQSQSKQIVTVTTAPLRTYSTPPIVKISEPAYPPLTAISKPEQKSPTMEQKKTTLPLLPIYVKQQKSPTPMHNLPARSPVQMKSTQDPNLLSPKSNAARLPITSVMVSKPLQPNTIILPQSKTAHTLEPPKLVSTSEPRPQEIPKVVLQTSTIQSNQYPGYVCTPTRMVVPATMQNHLRNLPHHPGLLVPSSYGLPNNSPNLYTVQSLQEKQQDKINSADALRLTPITSVPPSTGYQTPQQPVYIPNAHTVQKPFMNVIHETSSVSKPPVHQPSIIQSTAQSQMPPQTIQTTPSQLHQSLLQPLSLPSPQQILPSNIPTTPPTPQQQPQQQQQQPTPLQQTMPEASKTPEVNENPTKVITENLTTSTPSPVIMTVPKEVLPEPVPEVNPPTFEEKSENVGKVLENMESISEQLSETLKRESQEAEEKPIVEEKVEVPPKVETPPIEDKEKVEIKTEESVEKVKQEAENVSVIREIEKFDEEKADTESIVSDISKERSSADILSKDDPLDTKEDSDYWSAKEVNIDSVIKTLCSADELSDHSSDAGKDDWDDDAKANESIKSDASDKSEHLDKKSEPDTKLDDDAIDEGVENEEKEKVKVAPRGRGGRGRGRRARGAGVGTGILTRRGVKVTKEPVLATTLVTAKRGRGGRAKNERKVHKSESDTSTTDVYEFRDEADEGSKEQRPRLILTIKSPAVSTGGNTQTAIVKEVTKDGAKEIGKEVAVAAKEIPSVKTVDNKEEFASPVSNTRKSKRLQERDVSRNTVDDTIEDVVKNTVQTRGAQGARRSTRQVLPKQQQPETPKKSPRGGRRNQRRASEATDESDVEKPKDPEPVNATPIVTEPPKVEQEKPKEAVKVEQKKPDPPVKEVPHVGVKAEMLRRLKNEQSQEPTTLIDPVTGLLTPMRECEEGKYIPMPGDGKVMIVGNAMLQKQSGLPPKSTAEVKQASVITTQPQQVMVVQPPKPQSFKAHVLNSQAAKAVVSQQQNPVKTTTAPQVMQSVAPSIVVTKTSPLSQPPVVVSNLPPVTARPVQPVTQNLNVNVSMAMNMAPSHHSPRSSITLTKVKAPQHSPNQVVLNPQQMLQVSKQQAQLNKAHLSTVMANQQQVVNTQMAHMKQHQNVPQQLSKVQPQQQQAPVIINKSKPVHQMHQQIISNAVGSPPLSKAQQMVAGSRIIQGPMPGSKGVMEPPKVDVALGNIPIGARSTLSPQGQARHIAFEPSLGDQIAHFPPGTIRSIHDLPPYLHHAIPPQYQYMRPTNYHLPRSPMMPGNVEKSDGQEGEEAPVTSPPLELRRTNVGLPLTGRGTTVPHGLHSPHDRTTDSPQMYNVVHSARMQHYPTPAHAARYFDEPPPAHRPMTSHPLVNMGGDRPLHMPMGNPDRPLSSHIPPERPLSAAHVVPDRPLSSHIPPERALGAHIPPGAHLVPERPLSGHIPSDRKAINESHMMGVGLGAAGNHMGAVARHHGADTPTTQRGLQAATPPHASQVPPQAESLFMLLKQYPCMWQGLLALKNDQAAVQMYFVSGNATVAKDCLPENTDGTTPPLRIFQRMRLEPPQVEGVSRKMQMQNEHCMLLALPCGHDHMDVLKQSTNLTTGFIKYLQAKQAAGIVNVAAPGTTHPPAYVVHIFPSCEFVNENLRRIAPNLLERVADIAHLLIVVTTV